MTLPFAFVFIIAFIIIAIVLIFRKNKGKTEVKNKENRQNSPQGPVDTTRINEDIKSRIDKNKQS